MNRTLPRAVVSYPPSGNYGQNVVNYKFYRDRTTSTRFDWRTGTSRECSKVITHVRTIHTYTHVCNIRWIFTRKEKSSLQLSSHRRSPSESSGSTKEIWKGKEWIMSVFTRKGFPTVLKLSLGWMDELCVFSITRFTYRTYDLGLTNQSLGSRWWLIDWNPFHLKHSESKDRLTIDCEIETYKKTLTLLYCEFENRGISSYDYWL